MTRTSALTLSAAVSVLALGLAAPVDAQMPAGQRQGSTTAQMTAQFAQKSVMTNAFEIEAAKLALQKSQNTAIKNFAQKMINDHQMLARQMHSTTGGQSPAPGDAGALDQQHAAKLQQLRQASGASFDRLYIDSQVAGHREALDLHQQYAADGTDPQLKQVAAQAVPHIQQHLEEAQAIQSQTAQVPGMREVTPSDRSPSGQMTQPPQMRPGEQSPARPYQGMPPGQRQ